MLEWLYISDLCEGIVRNNFLGYYGAIVWIAVGFNAKSSNGNGRSEELLQNRKIEQIQRFSQYFWAYQPNEQKYGNYETTVASTCDRGCEVRHLCSKAQAEFIEIDATTTGMYCFFSHQPDKRCCK